MVYICLSIIICYTYAREHHGRVIWYISAYLSLSVTPMLVSTMAVLYGIYLGRYMPYNTAMVLTNIGVTDNDR
jgi:uncharacterized membrane protein